LLLRSAIALLVSNGRRGPGTTSITATG